jgi:hypothetical protein
MLTDIRALVDLFLCALTNINNHVAQERAACPLNKKEFD